MVERSSALDALEGSGDRRSRQLEILSVIVIVIVIAIAFAFAFVFVFVFVFENEIRTGWLQSGRLVCDCNSMNVQA